MGHNLLPTRHDDVDGRRFIIREAIAADARTLVHFTRTVLAENLPGLLTRPDEFDLTIADERRQLARSRRDPANVFLLAHRPGRRTVLGCLRATCDDRARVRHTLTLGVTVARRARGKGVGRALMQRCIDYVTVHPYLTRLALSVTADNESAIRLYRDLEFVEEGRRLNFVRRDDGTLVDMILMVRWLPGD